MIIHFLMGDYFNSRLAGFHSRSKLQQEVLMRPDPEDLDDYTQEIREQRSHESAQRAVPGEAPLKDNGQPAWRDVKEDED